MKPSQEAILRSFLNPPSFIAFQFVKSKEFFSRKGYMYHSGINERYSYKKTNFGFLSSLSDAPLKVAFKRVLHNWMEFLKKLY